jgi:WD domain, G-beta repeat.
MSIKIWNLKTQNLITCIKGHTGDILSILAKKANIISGSSDNTIKV